MFAIPVVGSGHAFVDAPDFLLREALGLVAFSTLGSLDFVCDAPEDRPGFTGFCFPERTEADAGVDDLDGLFVFTFMLLCLCDGAEIDLIRSCVVLTVNDISDRGRRMSSVRQDRRRRWFGCCCLHIGR